MNQSESINKMLESGIAQFRDGNISAAEKEFERAVDQDAAAAFFLAGISSTGLLSANFSGKIMRLARKMDSGVHEDGSMESAVPYLENIVAQSGFIYDGPAKYLARIIKETHPHQAEIVDIGTGPAPFAIALRKQLPLAYEITGYDVSDQMLSIARGRIIGLGLDISLLKGPVLDPRKTVAGDNTLPFGTGSIDIFISHGSMHHWGGGANDAKSVEVMFSELIRALKPGGRLLIFDINPAGFGTRFIVKSRVLKVLSRHYQHEAFKHSAEHSLSAPQLIDILKNMNIDDDWYRLYPASPLLPVGLIFHVLDLEKRGEHK